jgi:hypothetical protein
MDGQRIPGRSKSPRARTPTPKRLLA